MTWPVGPTWRAAKAIDHRRCQVQHRMPGARLVIVTGSPQLEREAGHVDRQPVQIGVSWSSVALPPSQQSFAGPQQLLRFSAMAPWRPPAQVIWTSLSCIPGNPPPVATKQIDKHRYNTAKKRASPRRPLPGSPWPNSAYSLSNNVPDCQATEHRHSFFFVPLCVFFVTSWLLFQRDHTSTIVRRKVAHRRAATDGEVLLVQCVVAEAPFSRMSTNPASSSFLR